MLKTPLLACGLMLAMLLPAQAEVSIDNFIAQMGPEKIIFRMVLHNMDDVVQDGPILIHLQSHSAPGKPWQDVEVWNVETLRGGQGWSEEFDSEDQLAAAKASKDYEARLWVQAPGLKQTEKLARQFK